MIEIYGIILTDSCANRTFLFLEVEAAFIYVSDKGDCLSEVYMYGFVLRYSLIKLIRVRDWAVFYTGSTARTFVLYNVSGLSNQRYFEVSCLSFYTVNFSIGQYLYIGMPADLDQFR